MKVRPARLADCVTLAKIHAESLDARDSSMEVETSPERFARLLGEREALLVLEEDGVAIGWGVVKPYSDRPGYRVAGETSIYLRRHLTGGGRGSLLQAALMARCRDFGYHHVVARIWASNEGSIHFHRKFGFEMVGVQREVGYLNGAWRDVAIMQCILAEVPPFRPDDF